MKRRGATLKWTIGVLKRDSAFDFCSPVVKFKSLCKYCCLATYTLKSLVQYLKIFRRNGDNKAVRFYIVDISLPLQNLPVNYGGLHTKTWIFLFAYLVTPALTATVGTLLIITDLYR